MIDYRLVLDYRLAPGWLKPWVDGILEGSAVGRKCEDCDRVSFVPLRFCDCGCGAGDWVDLPGTATIVHRTEGSDGAFALVQFHGADTQTVVRLEDFDHDTVEGRLSKPGTGRPALVLSASGSGGGT